MIGYGTTDSRIVRIPKDKIIIIKNAKNIEITTRGEGGTEIYVDKDCNMYFDIIIKQYDCPLKFLSRKIIYGISKNSNQLTTNYDHLYFVDTHNIRNPFVRQGDILRLHTNGVLIKDLRVIIDMSNPTK